MAEHVISFSMPLDKAKKIARKSVQGKFAVLSDSGNTMKVGTPPMMTALITFEEGKITIAGKGLGAPVASTCASSIKLDIEDAEGESKNTSSNQQNSSKISGGNSVEEKLKLTKLLKEYKELHDSGVLDDEEYKSLKNDILEKLKSETAISDDKVTETNHIVDATISAPLNEDNCHESQTSSNKLVANEVKVTENIDEQRNLEAEKERAHNRAIRREKDRKRTIVLIINHTIGLIIGIVSIILITSVFKKFSFDRSFTYLDVRYNGDGTLYSVLNFHQILGGICISFFVLMWITSIISLIFIKKSKLNTIFKIVSSLCGVSFGITSYLIITNFIHNDFMEIMKYINGDRAALYRSFENVDSFALTFFILMIVILIVDIIAYIIVHNISKDK